MHSLKRNYWLLTLLACLIACGGKAIIDPIDGATANSGGSSTQSTGSAPNGVGGQGAGAMMVVSSSVAVSSSSGGPLMCDNSGQCDVCFECSVTGPCAEGWNECLSNQACLDMSECMENCTNSNCFQQCAQDNPSGVQDFLRALSCTLCDACENDCDQPPMLCN